MAMENRILKLGEKKPKRLSGKALHLKIDLLEREVSSGKCLLWATIKVIGGRIEIPNSMMKTVSDKSELHAHYDPDKEITVLQSKVKGDK